MSAAPQVLGIGGRTPRAVGNVPPLPRPGRPVRRVPVHHPRLTRTTWGAGTVPAIHHLRENTHMAINRHEHPRVQPILEQLTNAGHQVTTRRCYGTDGRLYTEILGGPTPRIMLPDQSPANYRIGRLLASCPLHECPKTENPGRIITTRTPWEHPTKGHTIVHIAWYGKCGCQVWVDPHSEAWGTYQQQGSWIQLSLLPGSLEGATPFPARRR